MRKNLVVCWNKTSTFYFSKGEKLSRESGFQILAAILKWCKKFMFFACFLLFFGGTYVCTHRRTGRCGVLAIATWAAWFWAAQGRLLTKKKEEKEKGEKGKRRKKERKKEKEKKRKKREEKKGKKTWDQCGPVIPCLGFVRHCIQGP